MKLYHATSDKAAIAILNTQVLMSSLDAIDECDEAFVSTTTNEKLRFFNGFPQTGNVQFVFDSDFVGSIGYPLKKVDRWDEVRIIPNYSHMGVDIQAVDHIIIERYPATYFKGWIDYYGVDYDYPDHIQIAQAEISMDPKGPFMGSSNPFGIIKMLAAELRIPVIDRR